MGHQDGKREDIGGSIGFLGGLGVAPSVSHGLLVINDGEKSAVEEGIGQDGGAHVRGGVIVVGRIDWVQDANACRFDWEE